MGFRFRKSVNLGGGFKINLSKHGIGYSWGTKGFRYTKKAQAATEQQRQFMEQDFHGLLKVVKRKSIPIIKTLPHLSLSKKYKPTIHKISKTALRVIWCLMVWKSYIH